MIDLFTKKSKTCPSDLSATNRANSPKICPVKGQSEQTIGGKIRHDTEVGTQGTGDPNLVTVFECKGTLFFELLVAFIKKVIKNLVCN